MLFDEKTFKMCYAKKWIIYMRVLIAILIILLLLRVLGVTFTVVIFAIFAVDLLVLLPLAYCHYIRLKNQAKRQRQWISNEKLYVERTIDNGFTLGGFAHHKFTYLFDTVSKVSIEKAVIIVEGSIHVIEEFNGNVKEQDVTTVKIPRVFTNEEQIIQYGGVSK